MAWGGRPPPKLAGSSIVAGCRAITIPIDHPSSATSAVAAAKFVADQSNIFDAVIGQHREAFRYRRGIHSRGCKDRTGTKSNRDDNILHDAAPSCLSRINLANYRMFPFVYSSTLPLNTPPPPPLYTSSH